MSFTLEIARSAPVATRTKFRMRRLLRIVRAAAFNAARDHIDQPLSPATHTSVTDRVIQVCRDTAKRYAHLRT
ncbi:MAG TPA: hypothetical protein VF534_01260 [Paraburkholderia sp.]